MYNVASKVMLIVATNGPMRTSQSQPDALFLILVTNDLQFFSMPCLKGRPALMTTPASMYSKQEMRKSDVFSEFVMFDSSCLILGGINLEWKQCQ